MEIEIKFNNGKTFNKSPIRKLEDTGSTIDDLIIIDDKIKFKKGNIKSWKVYFGL